MTNISSQVLLFSLSLPVLLHFILSHFMSLRLYLSLYFSHLLKKYFSYLSDCLITDLKAVYVVKVSFLVHSWVAFTVFEVCADVQLYRIIFVSKNLVDLVEIWPWETLSSSPPSLSTDFSSEYFCLGVHTDKLHCQTSFSDDCGCCILCVQLERVWTTFC